MKRKIYLELGITLIVGFLIGFFVNSIITDKRIKDFSMYNGETAFWRRALTEVQASDEQKQQIMPIIRIYSEETREIVHQSWEKIPPLWEEMEVEIMRHLSKEQQTHIKALQAERKTHMRESIKRRNNRDGKLGQEHRGERHQGNDTHERQGSNERQGKMHKNARPSPLQKTR